MNRQLNVAIEFYDVWDRPLEPGEVEDIRIAFDEPALSAAGIRVGDIAAHSGVGLDPLAAALIVLGFPVGHFLGAFFSEAGKDAWQRLKNWTERIAETRKRYDRPGAASIALRDSGRFLEMPGPDEAYIALFELDFAALPEGVLSWDAEFREWRTASGLSWDSRRREWRSASR